MSEVRLYDYWLPTEEEFIRFRVELANLIKSYRVLYQQTKIHLFYEVVNELEKLALMLCAPDN